MRRYRSAFGRRPRTKKIRPLVRVKERTAKKGGKCASCKGRYEKGDLVTVVIVKRRTYHSQGCVPVNAGQMPTATGVAGPAPINNTPTAVVAALSAFWTIGEAKLVAVEALQNAMVVVGKNEPITPEKEKAYEKFMKLKSLLLRPGTGPEGNNATKASMIQIIREFF